MVFFVRKHVFLSWIGGQKLFFLGSFNCFSWTTMFFLDVTGRVEAKTLWDVSVLFLGVCFFLKRRWWFECLCCKIHYKMSGVHDVFFSNDVAKTDVRCATVSVHFFLTCKFIQCVLHVFMDGSKVQYKKTYSRWQIYSSTPMSEK